MDNGYCKKGYELDICSDCGHYYELTDYCDEGLFEADEKQGERRPVEECLNHS